MSTSKNRSTPARRSRSLQGADGRPSERPRKTAELLSQRIVADIIDSDRQPGTMLPPEKQMLTEYEVGRGTLRESLRYLEMQGVLTIKPGPGGGPSIAPLTSRALGGTLALQLAREHTPFRAILDVRQTLEPTLAARSALVSDDEGLEEIEDSVERFISYADSPRRALEENRRFHDLIAFRAGNPVFAQLVMALNWIIDGSPLGVHFRPTDVRGAGRAHQLIFDAIAARDGDAAHQAMEKHLAEFTAYLERSFPEALEQPLRWEDVNY